MYLAKEGKTGVDEWVAVITGQGLLQVGYDMIGLCKFVGVGMGHELISRAIFEATGLTTTSVEIVAAVRRAEMKGLLPG